MRLWEKKYGVDRKVICDDRGTDIFPDRSSPNTRLRKKMGEDKDRLRCI